MCSGQQRHIIKCKLPVTRYVESFIYWINTDLPSWWCARIIGAVIRSCLGYSPGTLSLSSWSNFTICGRMLDERRRGTPWLQRRRIITLPQQRTREQEVGLPICSLGVNVVKDITACLKGWIRFRWLGESCNSFTTIVFCTVGRLFPCRAGFLAFSAPISWICAMSLDLRQTTVSLWPVWAFDEYIFSLFNLFDYQPSLCGLIFNDTRSARF